MMNEYWIVTENKTGRVIAHCGDINDGQTPSWTDIIDTQSPNWVEIAA